VERIAYGEAVGGRLVEGADESDGAVIADSPTAGDVLVGLDQPIESWRGL